MDESGEMVTGIYEVDGIAYRFSDSGAMIEQVLFR